MDYKLYKNIRGSTRYFEKKESLEIDMFKPNIWRLFSKRKNDKRSFKTFVFRFYISLLTFGRTEIYFAFDSNRNLIHSAYVIPRNFKYPFLQKDEWCIGPCNTPEPFRGQGIYQYVLSYILVNNPGRDFCMFIRNENTASQKGVVKAGFTLVGEKVTGSRILNRFCLVKDEENRK